MTQSAEPVDRSAKLYGLLLRAYPASFRRQYSGEMTLLFRELADDAWTRDGCLGLAVVWCRVLLDLARTIPQQHLLEWQGALQMTPLSPVKAVGLAACSVAGAFVLNVALFAVLNAVLWAGWASGALTSYQHWPQVNLWATLATLLPPLFTGLIARSAPLFFRPALTAPLGTMMFAAAASFADPRASWPTSVGYPVLVGVATLWGSYIAIKVRRHKVAVCAA